MGADATGFDPVLLLNGGLVIRETVRRPAPISDNVVLTNQVMISAAIPMIAGDVISRIAARTGGTAGATISNWWFALYDTNLALLQQTPDQASAALASNTTLDLAFNAPIRVPASGIYYAGFMVNATTRPSMMSLLSVAGVNAGLVAGQKIISQTSGSGLTATAPATIATPTSVGSTLYVACY
jgi:hypothetical protein